MTNDQILVAPAKASDIMVTLGLIAGQRLELQAVDFMSLIVLAVVTPVSTTGKVIAGILGAGTISAAGVLLYRHFSVEPAGDGAAYRPWRVPTAIMLGFCGLFVAVGVWIDPQRQPRIFLLFWTLTLTLSLLLLLVAGFDLYQVRFAARRERRRLFEQNRVQLQQELRDLEAARRRQGNGSGKPLEP